MSLALSIGVTAGGEAGLVPGIGGLGILAGREGEGIADDCKVKGVVEAKGADVGEGIEVVVDNGVEDSGLAIAFEVDCEVMVELQLVENSTEAITRIANAVKRRVIYTS